MVKQGVLLIPKFISFIYLGIIYVINNLYYIFYWLCIPAIALAKARTAFTYYVLKTRLYYFLLMRVNEFNFTIRGYFRKVIQW